MSRKKSLITEVEYQEILKSVHKANQRIQKLTNKYGERSWATIPLYQKLEDPKILALTKYGNIKVNRSMSDVKVKYIGKVTKEFLESTTSTIRGAESAIKKTKQSLKETFSDAENLEFMSDEEIGKLYQIVENKDWRDMTEMFDPSETWARMQRAKVKDLKFNEFTDLFKRDADIKDIEIRTYLKEIYDMYMK